MTSLDKSQGSAPTTRSAARIGSAILSAVVILATGANTLTKSVGLLELLIPGAVLGVLAVVLGAVARSKMHIILGIVAVVFSYLWFLLIVAIFGFV